MAKLPITELTQALASAGARWSAAETPMSLLDDGKRNKMLGVIVPPGYLKPEGIASIPISSYELEIDWRTRKGNHISPVKTQGGCGTCVSFSAIAVVEAMASIEKGLIKNFSEADLHFCSSHGANCAGWWHNDAFKQISMRGIIDESIFSYHTAFTNQDIWAGSPTCPIVPGRESKAVKVTSVNKIFHPTEVKNYLTSTGPVSAILAIYTDFFSYKSGVYHQVSGNFEGMHCVTIVGYSETEQCWIAKNSWDTSWGENGFFKFAYGECSMDDYDKLGVSGLVFPVPVESWFKKIMKELFG